MVDTITYIVCAGLGLDVDGESIPYVAGWGEDGALDAVNQFAATIDRLARRIEAALRPPDRPKPPTRAGLRIAARCSFPWWLLHKGGSVRRD